ncbi:NAD(P)-dependent oxidoreductase [Neorhizobium sp. NCHU2750]|uniref:NAD(P)-dependent oxidoreductase n=1 Tax=Neorhizobium sp. NCHU2750 TaxID=1825976 RepID=UPI000E764BE6|nr:6-phosphogluconate dehydrogenase [Neorhizobium sp. NCHU2750]
MATIGIIGAGAMGSGIGGLLASNGATVLTDLEHRSPATVSRAEAAGMTAATLAQLLDAEIVLSIVPPAEAVAVARRFADEARRQDRSAVYVDCNAISPATMKEVAETFIGTKVEVLDGCVIGLPPSGGKPPKLYVSSDADNRTSTLGQHGLPVRTVSGGIGAASALKMCYAGINKGLTGLGTAMMLAAIRSGADESLKSELAESAPAVDKKLTGSIPDMYPKAYRWVAEMEEIADFLGDKDPASLIFRGMAGLFQQMADDRQNGGELAAELNRLLA